MSIFDRPTHRRRRPRENNRTTPDPPPDGRRTEGLRLVPYPDR
jgi:hypothetical protein